ncbi:MAG: hypothetical protein HZB85_06175 [Deltaproteobacteria bacterium]|nr:hypothetical protein [Deltaproteobacteria bacterium]
MKNYLLVFHVIEDDNKDIGEDPNFENIPSWGICRPNIRRAIAQAVDNGTKVNLFFIGYSKPDKYFIKGWFEVGEKISHIKALERFPSRKNILLKAVPKKPLYLKKIDDYEWRYKERKEYVGKKFGGEVPYFLFTCIDEKEKYYIQNPADTHQIDNWKCSRIFICDKRQFKKCVDSNFCQKNRQIERFENYIVANSEKWIDIGKLLIPWEDIACKLGIFKSLKTPKGQHNALTLSEKEAESLISFLKNAKNR